MNYTTVYSIPLDSQKEDAVFAVNESQEPYLGIYDHDKQRHEVVKSATDNLITILVATKLIADVENILQEYPERIDRIDNINYIYKNAPIIIDNMQRRGEMKYKEMYSNFTSILRNNMVYRYNQLVAFDQQLLEKSVSHLQLDWKLMYEPKSLNIYLAQKSIYSDHIYNIHKELDVKKDI